MKKQEEIFVKAQVWGGQLTKHHRKKLKVSKWPLWINPAHPHWENRGPTKDLMATAAELLKDNHQCSTLWSELYGRSALLQNERLQKCLKGFSGCEQLDFSVLIKLRLKHFCELDWLSAWRLLCAHTLVLISMRGYFVQKLVTAVISWEQLTFVPLC